MRQLLSFVAILAIMGYVFYGLPCKPPGACRTLRHAAADVRPTWPSSERDFAQAKLEALLVADPAICGTVHFDPQRPNELTGTARSAEALQRLRAACAAAGLTCKVVLQPGVAP